MQEKVEAKMGVHQLLTRHRFYQQTMQSLSEILRLLQMPESLQPKNIQQNAINGLIKIIEKYNNKYSQYIGLPKFANVAKQIKDYVSLLLQDTLNLMTNKTVIINSSPAPPLMGQPMSNMPPMFPPMMPFMRPPSMLNPNGAGSEPGVQTDEMRVMEQQIRMQQQMYMYYYGMYGYPNPMFNPAFMNYPPFGATQPSKPGPNSGSNLPLKPNLPNNPNPYSHFNNNPMNAMSMMGGMNSMMNPMMSMNGINPMNGMNHMGPNNPMHSMNSMNPMNGMMNPLPINMATSTNTVIEKPKTIIQRAQISQKNNNEQIQILSNPIIPSIPSIPENNKKLPAKQPTVKSVVQKTKPSAQEEDKKHKQYLPEKQYKKAEKRKKQELYTPQKRFHNVNPPFVVNQNLKKNSSSGYNQLLRYCACRGLQKYQEQFLCNICNRTFHYQCLGLSLKNYGNGQALECYHCRMRFIDPLNKVKQVIAEYYIPNISESKFWVQCNLKPYDYLCRPKGSKNEIEMRCLKVCNNDNNEITWPDQCIIKLNGQRIIEIPALQINSSLKKRKDYSIIITQNIYNKMNESDNQPLQKVRLSLEIRTLNKQELNTKKIKNNYTFAFAIYFIQKLQVDDLYNRIVTEQKVPYPSNYIQRLMGSPQNDLEIDKIIINLRDPYTWDLIKTPVRGHKCSHGQCFDLKIFISFMMATRNRTWRCPVCGKDARKFMIDTQQSELISQLNQKGNVPSEISFLKDGTIVMKLQDQQEGDEDQDNPKSEKTKKISKQNKRQKNQNSSYSESKQLNLPKLNFQQKSIREINIQDDDDEQQKKPQAEQQQKRKKIQENQEEKEDGQKND